MGTNLLGIPFNKRWKSPSSLSEPAKSSGILKVECLVNSRCPFTRTPKKNDILNFNRSSVGVLGADNVNQLSTFASIEGVTLRPLFEYFHNFLIDQEGIELETYSGSRFVNPPYKEHQTWQILPSFFDLTYPMTISEYDGFWGRQTISDDPWVCLNVARWKYGYEPNFRSTYVGNDFESFAKLYTDIPNQTLRQVSAMGCKGKGVHWRLQKTTSLFAGQDFFIDFYKKALASDTNKIQLQPEEQYFSENIDPIYHALDIRNNLTYTMSDTGKTYRENNGVTRSKTGTPIAQVVKSSQDFDLTNQAYYIIELGVGNYKYRYFIILTERNNPTLIMVKEGVSFVLSIFKEFNSAQLFSLTQFRMIVRNHLGFLVIQFVGPGGELSAFEWVIARTDEIVSEKKDPQGNKQLEQKETPLIVPQGNIAIWGGNLLTSFCFCPLTYTTHLNINFPTDARYFFFNDVKSSGFGMYLSTAETIFHNNQNTNTKRQFIYSCDASVISDYKNTEEPIAFKLFPYTLRDHRSAAEYHSQIEVTPKLMGENDEKQSYSADLFMQTGNFKFVNGWELQSCINPILTTLRVVSNESKASLWPSNEKDISNNVMSVDDSWSAQDENTVEHTATLQLWVNRGVKNANYIRNLKNKAFYIIINVEYDFSDCFSKGNYTRLPGKYRLFTGIAYGGDIAFEHGKYIMNVTAYDYSRVLQDQILLNSPFFDGFYDVSAVLELLQMSSFKTVSRTNRDPGYLVKQFSDNCYNGGQTILYATDPSGRWIQYGKYSISDAYNKLQNPFFKFKDGTKFWEAIKQIAVQAGRVVFFDHHGIMHYETPAYRVVGQQISEGKGLNLPILYKYTWNPAKWEGQDVLGSLNFAVGAIDVFNHLKLLSTSPEGELINYNDENTPSFIDPNQEGFIGYRKTFMQIVPVGSRIGVKKLLRQYTQFYQPPFTIKFESYGVPIRPMDLISVNEQKFIVQKVNSTLDASKNKWWQNIEAEWFQPEFKEIDTTTE